MCGMVEHRRSEITSYGDVIEKSVARQSREANTMAGHGNVAVVYLCCSILLLFDIIDILLMLFDEHLQCSVDQLGQYMHQDDSILKRVRRHKGGS